MSSQSPDDSDRLLTRLYSPALGLIPPESWRERYDDSLTFFRSVGWTERLLSQPDTFTYLPHCRNSRQSEQEQLFSSTLHSPTTIPHLIGVFQAPEPALRDPDAPVTTISLLLYLGDGLSGVSNCLHGGVTMAVLDDAMGQVIELNTALKKAGSSFNGSSVTGTLETKFRKLIPLGTVVRAESTLERVDGRKTFVRCKVTDEDGTVLAEGTSIWLCLQARM